MNQNVVATVAEISTREFEQFRQFMLAASGVDLGPTKRALVQARLSRRVTQLGLKTFGDYWKLVSAHGAETERQFVVNALSTNETFFFREVSHFEWLAERVRQQIADGRRLFRVWSAACSSGEEAYTAAIVLKETCGKQCDFEVIATDINTQVLRDARRAVYPRGRAQKVPVHLLHRYFMYGRDEYSDMLRVVPEVTGHVRFSQFNLLGNERPSIGEFDVIFLRNVMIYFNDDTKAEVLENVGRHLRHDGVLIISHSETLNGIRTEFTALRPSLYTLRRNGGNGT